jgi:plastocyanin
MIFGVRLSVLMVLTVVISFILHTASLEAALARDIKITGISPRGRHQWVISIDGQEQSGSEVQVTPGDRIEWHVGGGQHGVTFEEFAQAEQFLDLEQVQAFEPDAGTQYRRTFGPNHRGTKAYPVNTLLARATVKDQSTIPTLPFACTSHGGHMTGILRLQR